MKIKLDENLPLHLATSLEDLGHDLHTTSSESLAGRVDLDIWRAAQAESRFLITQDLDFSDIRQFTPGSHATFFWFACTRLADRVSSVGCSMSSRLRAWISGRDAS